MTKDKKKKRGEKKREDKDRKLGDLTPLDLLISRFLSFFSTDLSEKNLLLESIIFLGVLLGHDEGIVDQQG